MHLAVQINPFDELLNSAPFEKVGKGRVGAVLLKPSTDGVPIVRTTTAYKRPAHCFERVHQEVAGQIEQKTGAEFNNALIECYSSGYRKMGAHSDQELDLNENSLIAIFSCYKKPDAQQAIRKLVVQSKSSEETFEIELSHNSAVVFSVATNRLYKHKIVLNNSTDNSPSHWLGVTLRMSKTFVRYSSAGKVELADSAPLTLANEEQRRLFFKLRRQENMETNFNYPPLAFTISESDRIPPTRT